MQGPLCYGGENVKEILGFTTFSIVYSPSAWYCLSVIVLARVACNEKDLNILNHSTLL